MPSDKPTVSEKSAQRYVFLGEHNDADPVSYRDSPPCVWPTGSAKVTSPCRSLHRQAVDRLDDDTTRNDKRTRGYSLRRNPLIFRVAGAGFEPATFGL
jgi:hypothetical protein